MTRRRRQFLAAVGTAIVATAGCRGALTRGSDGDTAGDGAGSGDAAGGDRGGSESGTSDSVEAPTIAQTGRPGDICDRPIGDSDIVAIRSPAFGDDWPSSVGPPYRALRPDSTVVGVTAGDGRARAYPLSILAVHEVVNDSFDGPLLVTFCPLCRSGVVADRRVAGHATTFDVTGELWQPEGIWAAASEDDGRVASDRPERPSRSANLVMYDHATGSYWSQYLGQAICGPRTGDRLEIRPFAFTTWGDWQTQHPETEVLLPPPESEPIRRIRR